MSTCLIEPWAHKFPPAAVRPVAAVLSTEFSYWRGFGARIEAGAVTLEISGGSERPMFESTAEWPDENLEKAVIDGLLDAMHQYAGAPLGIRIKLKSIKWDAVRSSPSGFYFAAREALFAALRIVEVPKEGP